MNLGRYRLLAQLGAGADGLAFQALEDQTDRTCEVRDLAGARANPARWQQVVRRLRMAALLQHPAQRQLLDMSLEQEPPFIVMEATNAPLLAELRQEDLPWAPAQVRKLAIELAGALQEAHRLGLVHGALSPSKIHWQSGAPAQVDFTGVDCHATPPRPVDDACAALEGKSGPSLDPAVDMVALGVILSWLLRGRPAPPGWSLRADYPDGADQTPLLSLIESLLRVEAGERPSAQALLEALSFGHSSTLKSKDQGVPSVNSVADFEPTRLSRSPIPQAASALAAETTLKVIGRFRLLQLIGEGGLGKVYRAEDITDGAAVAIKILHAHLASRPAILQRFLKEARLLREVQSPFVANILEINEDRGVHYLALEFIAGPSLNELLKDRALCPRGRLAEAHALALISDVTRGLADAHRRGIIHRDIKPQNIMVVRGSGLFRMLESGNHATAQPPAPAESGTKLCDFGLARHVIETDSLHLTQEGTPVGTPLYMSPEQAAGQLKLGPPTDVYALGATLYQLLAGRPPFIAESALALSLLHTGEPPPPLTQFEPTLSDGICRIVYKCLAKKAAERYLDADALLEDLERLARGEPASMTIHPRLPEGAHVLQYDWAWELASSPAQLWPFVSNTERLNRAAGVPAVDYRTEAGTTSVSDGVAAPVRRYGSFRKAGVDNIWQEHPFEWVEGKRMGVLREYEKGVFKWLASTTELVPTPGGGCKLLHQVRVEPRGLLGRLVAGMEVGFKGKRRLEQVYRRIDGYLRGQLHGSTGLDPFEEPVRLSREQTRRLEQHLRSLLDKNVPADVASQLAAFLENAPDQEVARIRPLALARRLGVSSDAMVTACLQGARAGLLVLLWDILCPLCRIPAGIVDTLKALKDHGHCEACQADFALDFTNSVEMIFRVHPEVRTCETRTYCAGGPAHSPHVVAQVRVAAGERFDLDLALPEGAYRVRGPQLPRAFDFQVEAGAFLTRWSLQVPGDLARSRDGSAATLAEGTLLRAGQQRLVFHNDHAEELVLRVERTARRDDALTAARAASSALFRELFPGEILESGKLVSVAAVTLLVLDLTQATNLDNPDNLYHTLGEARTFGLLHDYFQLVEEAGRREAGAVIKTLGETVLVAFEDKAAAVRAGLVLAQGLSKELSQRWPNLHRPLQIRAGIHHGPAMSATVNGTLDYFGTTVDQALRLPALIPGDHLVLSRALAADRRVVELLREFKLKPEVLTSSLPGQSLGVLLSVPLQ